MVFAGGGAVSYERGTPVPQASIASLGAGEEEQEGAGAPVVPVNPQP